LNQTLHRSAGRPLGSSRPQPGRQARSVSVLLLRVSILVQPCP